MKHFTTEELYIVVYHLPFQVVATGSPVVVIVGFVAFYADEVFVGVGSQLAVEVGSGDYGLLVFSETAGSVLHNGEGYGHHFVESVLVFVKRLILKFVYLGEDSLTLVERSVLDGALELGNLFLLCFGGILHVSLYLLGFGTEFVVTQGFDVRIFGLYFLYKRLNMLHIACGLVTEK